MEFNQIYEMKKVEYMRDENHVQPITYAFLKCILAQQDWIRHQINLGDHALVEVLEFYLELQVHAPL